jgi:hypothetical protein
MGDNPAVVQYTKLLIRIWDADAREGGMRLTADDVEILRRAMFDGVTREDLVAQVAEFSTPLTAAGREKL